MSKLLDLFKLTKIYSQSLLAKREFIVQFAILSFLGFLLIPNDQAAYVTFYIGNYGVVPNEYWLAPFAAVMSNVILFPLVIFTIINARKEDNQNSTLSYSSLSTRPHFIIHLHRILGLFIIWIILLLLFNFSVVLSNFANSALLYHVQSLLYYNVSFIFLTCTFAYFIEFSIQQNWKKFGIYFLVYFTLILFDKNLFNLIGLNELFLYVSNIQEVPNYYAMGYLNKEALMASLALAAPAQPLFIWTKIACILITFGLILGISSSAPALLKKLNAPTVNPSISKRTKAKNPRPSSLLSTINLKRQLPYLFQNELFLLGRMLSLRQKLSILLLWALSFFIPLEYHYFTDSLLFLSLMKLNSFCFKLHQNDNCTYYEKLSIYKGREVIFSRFIIVLLCYFVALIPLLSQLPFSEGSITMVNFTLLAFLVVGSSRVFKSAMAIDIIYIILFTSSLTNSPFINIFNL
ncbi:hypothetical protein GCM10007049_23320 [Echinicola pacifica]|uniref:Uncharacterized protein n=1 Tax=Echinicola pacifica TaxID=346377 RepID=A0A918Q301_9BACT|nr:hypothetical protein [Echinicola pacifica]GGZ29430.1 hypothetical protein GCM10007049_23320 [Echinicola pacifica]